MARICVQRVEMFAHGLFNPRAFCCLLPPLFAETCSVRAKKDVGQAALFLQRMDQPADGAHQFAGKCKLFQLRYFTLAGGDKKTESGFHHGVLNGSNIYAAWAFQGK